MKGEVGKGSGELVHATFRLGPHTWLWVRISGSLYVFKSLSFRCSFQVPVPRLLLPLGLFPSTETLHDPLQWCHLLFQVCSVPLCRKTGATEIPLNTIRPLKPAIQAGWGLLFVGCSTSQQHASISQGPICSDNFTCCHTEIELADQTFHFTQSQYTDTGPTNPSADPITPGAWQGSHWSANF